MPNVLDRRGGRATLALGIALGLIFMLELAAGSANFMNVPAGLLAQLGGNARALTAEDREYWRLVSAVYLHGGLLHVAFNVYALYVIGTAVELALGAGWMMTCFVVSGVLGGVVSMLGNRFGVVSIGASGGIFGLIAMAASLTWLVPRDTTFRRDVLVQWIIFGLVLGVIGGFDNWGHVGGIAGGVLTGLVWAGLRKRRQLRETVGRIAGIAATVVSVLGIAAAGVSFKKEQREDVVEVGARGAGCDPATCDVTAASS